jgi:hypothetical protein
MACLQSQQLAPSSSPAKATSGSSKVSPGSGRHLKHQLLTDISGVAYQLIEDDPLVKAEQCEVDAEKMKELGVNAIRVYHVNETANHDACMNSFAKRGIYTFIDLDSFKTYIRYGDVSSWNAEKSNSYRAVMDNFQQYDNCAGFLVGNEVLNSSESFLVKLCCIFLTSTQWPMLMPHLTCSLLQLI